MNEELKAALSASTASDEEKREAVLEAFKASAEIAYSMTGNQAGGDFIALLLELFKILLPILLELLNPNSVSEAETT